MMLLFNISIGRKFEVSKYIITTIKEMFQQIGHQIQLETHLIKKDVSEEAFTEVVVFYGMI